jgi:hypothetical protein
VTLRPPKSVAKRDLGVIVVADVTGPRVVVLSPINGAGEGWVVPTLAVSVTLKQRHRISGDVSSHSLGGVRLDAMFLQPFERNFALAGLPASIVLMS